MHIPFLQKHSRFALPVLRIGLGFVVLWFSWQQLSNPAGWVRMVPEWTAWFGLSATTVIYINAITELISGVFLVVNMWTPIVAFLMALHMVPIIVQLGFNAVGVRDIGLAASYLALSLMPDRT